MTCDAKHYPLIHASSDVGKICITDVKGKGKAVPLQARRGPEGSRKLRFPDFVTAAQDGGRCNK